MPLAKTDGEGCLTTTRESACRVFRHVNKGGVRVSQSLFIIFHMQKIHIFVQRVNWNNRDVAAAGHGAEERLYIQGGLNRQVAQKGRWVRAHPPKWGLPLRTIFQNLYPLFANGGGAFVGVDLHICFVRGFFLQL